MQLATEQGGQPNICTLHYAFDEQLCLYWMSFRDTNHSQELKANSRTSVTILHDEAKYQCVHIKGEAFELNGRGATDAHKLYWDRFESILGSEVKTWSDSQPNRVMYVFKPSNFVLFDRTNFPHSPRQEFTP